jgi:hypothetical protein
MQRSAGRAKTGSLSTRKVAGRCVCGDVKFEIDYPAFWAWHDHSDASRRAQGCAYATYVGTWRSRFRVLQGSERITRFDEPKTGEKRSFCARCGTPLFYERASAPKWVNIPRALFSRRTGREPRYHLSIQEKVDWAYMGEPGAAEGLPRCDVGPAKAEEKRCMRKLLTILNAMARSRKPWDQSLHRA